jgi:hypothetical protein
MVPKGVMVIYNITVFDISALGHKMWEIVWNYGYNPRNQITLKQYSYGLPTDVLIQTANHTALIKSEIELILKKNPRRKHL